ncbi:HNH endonuclease [Changpingibacter yushuensis]|uniref:HNH endonuclease n=1 Tax=Changpingibacter yushuensis TaxID=2758440 RepID=UPI0037439329
MRQVNTRTLVVEPAGPTTRREGSMMKRSAPLTRKTPLTRRPWHPRRQRVHTATGRPAQTTIPTTVRKAVGERSSGSCDWCGKPLLTFDAHHRQLRSRGGEHTAANLVALHRACHEHIHQHPGEATSRGFMVHSWETPEQVPVLLSDGRVCLPGNTWVEVES